MSSLDVNGVVEDGWRRLDRFRKNYTSQSGEDGIIEKLIELLPETPKVCLEVGAHDGISMSNTHRLWASCGWRAILIEADPANFEVLKKNTIGFANVVSISSMITPTGEQSLAQLLSNAGVALHIGVLSLDIDSNELEIFENFGDLKADIVVIEFNHDFPPDVYYRDQAHDVFFRHSVKAVEEVAMRTGYKIVACAGPNAILVRKAAITALAESRLPDLPVEALFDYAFMRRKYPSRAVVRSKMVSEELAFLGTPTYWQKFALRALTALRKIRRMFVGGSVRQNVTPARRKHLESSGFWI